MADNVIDDMAKSTDITDIKVKFQALDSIDEGKLFFEYEEELKKCHDMIHNFTGRGNDFLGWVERPLNYDREEFTQIKEAAEKIKTDSDVLLVVGIGGSYLGARAVIEALNHNFFNQINNQQNKQPNGQLNDQLNNHTSNLVNGNFQKKSPEIYYIGHNMSSSYIADLFDIIREKEISVNVISKSGTTTEPAIAFRLVKQLMEDKYGQMAASRIYVTTDKAKGTLKKLAAAEGYRCFVIPDDIGGRYSVLTPVGLLPIAVSGVDINELMRGAAEGYREYSDKNFAGNQCYKYAVYRNKLYKGGRSVEILVNYEPNMMFFGEWWKQLYGESEGKEGKGLFPASANFTTDLHSLGQYIQEGPSILFETVIDIVKPESVLTVPAVDGADDGLDYLEGKDLQYVNKKAMEGTIAAHNKGDVPNVIISVPEMNAYYMGKLIYFFEKACGMSGYMLGVNPFDQPGVEEYKSNMFRLLGKPGVN